MLKSLGLPIVLLMLIFGEICYLHISASASERALDFTIDVCFSEGNCQTESVGLVMDYSYFCDDPTTCYEMPTKDDYEIKYGLIVQNGAVTFDWRYRANRLYITSGDQYRMFYLLNNEITFDVDLSTVGCGLNAAIDFTCMPFDGGKIKYNYTGAQYGTGFCGGEDDPPNCLELDIIEANSLATMYTVHPCNETSGKCNAYGCGLNNYPLGYKNFYGRGSNFTVDTTKPFSVVTRFITTDGTDSGDLKEIQQFYVQDGKIIESPQVAGGFNAISDEFCNYHLVPDLPPGYDFLGVTSGMTSGMKEGMVLTVSLWGDLDDTYMWWLDQEPYGPCPIYSNPNATVTYSKIRFGPIGSTTA